MSCLPETFPLHSAIIGTTLNLGVPVHILTKRTDWIYTPAGKGILDRGDATKLLNVGFTLTGMDELEPGSSSNEDRITALRELHDNGVHTFASIEPVIDLDKSYKIIESCSSFVDLFKVGLESGGKYKISDLRNFVDRLRNMPAKPKIYLKDNIVNKLAINREDLECNFVGPRYLVIG